MALITKASVASALLQATFKSLESTARLTTAAAVSTADSVKKTPRVKKFAVYRWVNTRCTQSVVNNRLANLINRLKGPGEARR